MMPISEELLTGPFPRAQAIRLKVTPRVLEGRRFVRVFPQVYCHASHGMTEQDWIAAAAMALPPQARTTGLTRIQQLGLDFGPRRPLRFVLAGDVHPHLEGVFVHRTKQLAPTDEVGVIPSAAYLSYCRRARVIDAIKVGDWLLHHRHMTEGGVRDLALAAPWRDGADEALWVLAHLDGNARSLKESETRAVLAFAGLPPPEVNTTIALPEDVLLIADLQYREWNTVVEYEGSHHQDDRGQYVSDIDRYAILRRHGRRYVQVTKEKLDHPRTLVGEVYRELVAAGYAGRPPELGDRWRSLFGRVTDQLAVDRELSRLRRRAVG